jgi:DUF2938 family protein
MHLSKVARDGTITYRECIHPFIKPEVIGRWFPYMFKGKFVHKDIQETPALRNEKLWCLISHYLIGVALAGIYLLLEFKLQIIQDQNWLTIFFGIVTVVLPWFWLLQSTGFGIMALKTLIRSQIIRTNLINHTDFGLGLFIA